MGKGKAKYKQYNEFKNKKKWKHRDKEIYSPKRGDVGFQFDPIYSEVDIEKINRLD